MGTHKWTTKVGTRTKQENANQNYMTNCLIPVSKKTKPREEKQTQKPLTVMQGERHSYM